MTVPSDLWLMLPLLHTLYYWLQVFPYPDTASQPFLMPITVPAGPTFEYFYLLASFENKVLPLNVTGGSYGQARGNFSRFITRLNPRCFLPDLRAQVCNHNYFGGWGRRIASSRPFLGYRARYLRPPLGLTETLLQNKKFFFKKRAGST